MNYMKWKVKTLNIKISSKNKNQLCSLEINILGKNSCRVTGHWVYKEFQLSWIKITYKCDRVSQNKINVLRSNKLEL